MISRIPEQLPQTSGSKDEPIVLDDAGDGDPEAPDMFKLPPELTVRELVDDFLDGFNQAMPLTVATSALR
ncbi:hypothetical protein NW768_007804 [Fusarium equiseti]|uniref:Reverse transcriptase domain-containing protein n=1 Tax=Fusarium equiseti TaxID=61235 RepID=A0ABQ8R8L1_FUSEQ|nr:hypothetical protein NW768_007804 [Fusarium equiseti]